MKVIVVGNGVIGSAVQQTPRDHGHDVVDIGRTRGTYKADTTNIDELRALFPVLTPFDAVANAAGDAFLVPLTESTDAQWAASIHAKGMGQINLVRAALPHISAGGSFTLVSGIPGDEFNPASSIGATVDYINSARSSPALASANYSKERTDHDHFTLDINRPTRPC
jgi:NAD(P)-dependent dehydrogenase (short-subunit alcohol dehydrogenase family)